MRRIPSILLLVVVGLSSLNANATESSYWELYGRSLSQEVVNVGWTVGSWISGPGPNGGVSRIGSSDRFGESTKTIAQFYSSNDYYGEVGFFFTVISEQFTGRVFSIDGYNSLTQPLVMLTEISGDPLGLGPNSRNFNVTFADSTGISGVVAQVGYNITPYIPSGSPEAGQVAGFGIALSLLMGRLVSRRKRVQGESVRPNTVVA